MLKPGQRFLMGGNVWRVLHVNDSRAHIKCEKQQQVTIGERSFTAKTGETANISPNSLVEMLPDADPGLPEMLHVLPPEGPVQPGQGWHRTDAQVLIRDGSRLEKVLVYLTAFPGSTSAQLVAALGKGADQICADLKRKGMVERK